MARVSDETIQRFRKEKLAEKNPNWKGDKVGLNALHEWVKSRLRKPALCQKCFKQQPYDMANVTGIYKRDLQNWKYLCRRCHMTFDGRFFARDKTGKWISPKQIRIYSPLSRRSQWIICPNIFVNSGSGLGQQQETEK